MPRGVRAGLAALVLVALAPLPAAGQETGVVGEPSARAQAVDQELSRLADELEEMSHDEARAVAEWQVSKREEQAIAAEVRRLDAALAANQAALAAAETARVRAEQAERQTAARLVSAQAQVVAARDHVRRVALLVYTGQGQLDLAARILEDADTGAELAIGFTYADVVGEVQRGKVEQLRRDEAAVRGLEADAARARDATAAAKAALANRQADLEHDRTARGAALAKAAAETKLQRGLVIKVQAAQAGYQARIDALQSESASIAALLRSRAVQTTVAAPPTAARAVAAPVTTKPAAARPATATTKPRAAAPAAPPVTARPAPAKPARPAPAKPAPVTTRPPAPAARPAPTTRPAVTTTDPQASAKPTAPVGPVPPQRPALSFPLPGWPIVSGFGSRVHPILGIRRMHEGIDIWAPAGTPIRAAADGVVVWAGPRGGYGNAVILDHGGGLGTVYAHQSAVGVSQGQVVKQGDVVGYVGQTGLAAGPHLHFEVRINGVAYDPLNFVRPG